MPRALILVVLLFLSHFAAAQQETGEELLAQARQTYTEKGPRDALPVFEQALSRFREAGDRRNEAITLGYIGNCHKRLGDYTRALEFHNRALQMKRDLGDRLEEGKTLTHLGLVYWEMGDYKKAIESLTPAVAIGRALNNPRLVAAALNNLSLVYDEQGDYRRSLEQYRQALDLHRSLNAPEDESYILGNIGGVHLLLGQFREALSYYQQSLAISERLNLKQGASLDLGNMALCFAGLGHVPEALTHFDRALALAKEAGLKKEEADWHKGKGTALAAVGRYNDALAEHALAIGVYERAGLKRELVQGLTERGSLLLMLGDTTSAEQDFRRGTDLSREIGHPRGITFGLIALANVELYRGRYDQAATAYREAYTRAAEAGDRHAMATVQIQLAHTLRREAQFEPARAAAEKALEEARQGGARPSEARALHALGEVARESGQLPEALGHLAKGDEIARELGDPELLWRLAFGRGRALEALERTEEAVAAYRDAIATIEGVRSQLREDRFRAGYLEDKYQVYVALVQLLLRMGKSDEAFHAAEKLRARSYLDLLNRGLPPIRNEAQRQREAALRERIRRLQSAIEQERDRDRPDQEPRRQALEIYSEELAAAEREFQTLLDDLLKSEPAYGAARALRVPSTDEVQTQLPADTALVEYLVGDDSLSVFVLTRGQLRAKTVPSRQNELRARVELLRDLITRADSNDWQLPAVALRRILIEPLEKEGWLKGVSKLVLVPHGLLHYVPFAALPRSAGGTNRFLLDDYELSYLPAASALAYGRSRDSPLRSLMAMAPERARLRYAQQEARSITRQFSGESLLLAGKLATESAFKRQAPGFRVVHLATHGYFNKLNPLFSGVELEAGGDEDGRLEVHEILGLQISADLVTLSACQTALGSGYFSEAPPGDDLVGLTRAFLFAGSPSVLATLWEVDDRSTLELMQAFYGDLRDASKATALAGAQRKLRNGNGRYRHPYYWAPFVLVGRPD